MKKTFATTNLTPSQVKVIEDTIGEFVKLNKEEASKPINGLIDMDELINERNMELAKLSELKRHNKKVFEIYRGICKSAVERLNADLNPHGMHVVRHDADESWKTIIIDDIKHKWEPCERYSSRAIRIGFKYATDTVTFKSGIGCYGKLYGQEVIFWDSCKARAFDLEGIQFGNIEMLTASDLFKNRLKSLYHSIHKTKD